MSIKNLNEREIEEFITNRLAVKPDAKEANGEVFTPPSLIKEMLDALPPAVWTNPNLKWLDPANGIGNFPMIVYSRLMTSLAAAIPEKDIRSTHIIERMLYMVEISPSNVAVSLEIFGPRANIICADFLQGGLFGLGIGVELFDIIIGNPPYNSNGIKHHGEKNIYVFFVLAAFMWLKPDGLLLYLHPPAYRIPNHRIQCTNGTNLNGVYTGKQILCIKMFTIEMTKALMQVMINVDYILVKNAPNDGANITRITDTQGRTNLVCLAPGTFIPNYGGTILAKLEKKATKEAAEEAAAAKEGHVVIHLDSEMHKQHTEGTTYKNIHGITKKGLKICWSDKQHSLYSKRKLIINGIGSYNYVFYDAKGEYGLTQSPLAIVEPTANTLKLVESKLFHYIAGATKIIGNNFLKQTALFLPLISEKIKIKSKEDLYMYIGLTEAEIEEVETTIKEIPAYVAREI